MIIVPKRQNDDALMPIALKHVEGLIKEVVPIFIDETRGKPMAERHAILMGGWIALMRIMTEQLAFFLTTIQQSSYDVVNEKGPNSVK